MAVPIAARLTPAAAKVARWLLMLLLCVAVVLTLEPRKVALWALGWPGATKVVARPRATPVPSSREAAGAMGRKGGQDDEKFERYEIFHERNNIAAIIGRQSTVVEIHGNEIKHLHFRLEELQYNQLIVWYRQFTTSPYFCWIHTPVSCMNPHLFQLPAVIVIYIL